MDDARRKRQDELIAKAIDRIKDATGIEADGDVYNVDFEIEWDDKQLRTILGDLIDECEDIDADTTTV